MPILKSLIGNPPGQLVSLSLNVAESCLANGTHTYPTDEEIANSGLRAIPEIIPEELPKFPEGYESRHIPGGGFELVKTSGESASDKAYPNVIAARDAAWGIVGESFDPEAASAEAQATQDAITEQDASDIARLKQVEARMAPAVEPADEDQQEPVAEEAAEPETENSEGTQEPVAEEETAPKSRRKAKGNPKTEESEQ